MNKNVTLPFVALIMVLAMVGAASAATTVDKVEVRGTVQEITTLPATAYPTYTWDAQSFAGFWYDMEKDTYSEMLTIQALGAGVNTIPKPTGPGTGLTYTTTMCGAEYKNPSLNIAGNDYIIMRWFAKKYMAVNNQPDVLSKIILEMDDNDTETLVVGEAFDLGNGYSLIAKQINLAGDKVWLSLEKNGVEVESSVIDTGVIPSGDSFIDMNGNTIATNNTFVYQPDIGTEHDVPIFTVAVTTVSRDTNSTQIKYAMLIDDELLKIGSDYESHKMKVTGITGTTVTMQNDETITLTEDSDIEIIGDIVFHIAEDKDGDMRDELRFYPLVEYTDPGTYEIRGTMAEIVPAGLGLTTWNGQSFAGFWYDVEKDTQSETLTIQALGAGINTIPKPTCPGTGLRYTATMHGANYKNPSIQIAGNDYMIIGWFAKKYMAVNNQPDVLSKILLEMGSTDKKTLATGEKWDLGNGYALIANQIDLEGVKVWLSLEKNGVEVESSIIDTGMGASDSFIDMNGNTIATTNTFVYQPDIGSESDVPIFTVAVTAVFRGTDTNVIQLKYAMLIDDELLKIDSDYESHKMKVTSITATTVTMQNDETITLTEDSDIEIIGDIVFHVAEDKDGDGIQEYRFYPMVKRTIGDGVAPAEPPATIASTDTDGDGVPDVWDEEADTPTGYWVNSEGIGRRLGDMNGDGELTSVDALMILQAAVGAIDL